MISRLTLPSSKARFGTKTLGDVIIVAAGEDALEMFEDIPAEWEVLVTPIARSA